MGFLTLIVVGMVGLLVMALPAFGLGARSGGHGVHAIRAAHPTAHPPAAGVKTAPDGGLATATRFLPSPRAIFSVLAIYGALGNALVRAGHLTPRVAIFVALFPALAVERFVISPLWSWMFRYQAKPSSPLHELLMQEAKAVTAFRNGRGIVAVERDGRLVQFMARLPAGHAAMRIRVGETLRVDEVDGARECLVVGLPAAGPLDPLDEPAQEPRKDEN